jgi:tetratricopeptide (TPR) repeat protein
MPLGRAEEAVTWARRGVELDPKHPAIRHALAQALDAVGKPEEALAQLEAIEGNLPPHMLALSGWLKAQIGRVDEGIGELRRAAEVMPQHWLAHNYLARALLQEDRLEEALGSAQRAVAVAPGNPPAEFLLGLVLGRLGRVTEAEAAYERGLANLDLVAARVELAELPAVGGDPEESVRRLRAIVASHPDDMYACSSLAWGLATYPLSQRSAAEALGLARRVLEREPDRDHRLLAAALFRAGKHAEAEEKLAVILEESDDGHACLAYLRALNLHALGEAEEAKRWYEEAEKRFASEGEIPLHDHRWLRDEAKRVFGR